MEPFALEGRGRFVDFGLPARAEVVHADRLPATLLDLVSREIFPFEGPYQLETRDPRTVVGEQTAGGQKQTDPIRPGIAHRSMVRTIQPVDLLEPLQSEWLQGPCNLQFEEMGGGAGSPVGAEQQVGEQVEALNRNGLQT